MPLGEQQQEIESTRAECNGFCFSGLNKPEKTAALKPKPVPEEESIGQI